MTGTTGEPLRSAAVLQLALAFLAGASLPLQARANGTLATAAGDGVFAALVSFGGGLLLLAVAIAVSRGARRAVATLASVLRERRLSPWLCLAGAFGAWLVIAQSISVGLFGVALFSIALIAGQTVSGLLVDGTGFLTGIRRALTAPRLLAGILTIVAVAWSVSGSIPAGLGIAATLLIALLPLSAGLTSGFQQAMNGRISAVTAAPFSATALNFLVGTVVLLLATIVERAVRAEPALPAGLPGEWWAYTGGVWGVLFIFVGAYLVPRLGVLRLTVVSVAGQLTGSLLLDWWAPADGATITAAKLGAAALTFLAVALSALPPRRSAAR